MVASAVLGASSGSGTGHVRVYPVENNAPGRGGSDARPRGHRDCSIDAALAWLGLSTAKVNGVVMMCIAISLQLAEAGFAFWRFAIHRDATQQVRNTFLRTACLGVHFRRWRSSDTLDTVARTGAPSHARDCGVLCLSRLGVAELHVRVAHMNMLQQ